MFWNFLGNFLEDFFAGMFMVEFFWGEFFGRIFLGGNLREEFFVYIGIDLFVKILSQWRRRRRNDKNLDP